MEKGGEKSKLEAEALLLSFNYRKDSRLKTPKGEPVAGKVTNYRPRQGKDVLCISYGMSLLLQLSPLQTVITQTSACFHCTFVQNNASQLPPPPAQNNVPLHCLLDLPMVLP